ncbi:MAG TPA: VWA domain-containing protein [Gammaproteobacteria bacterium]|nr:VWA domain-containing protein [Gammaproteobacteria bacterium]
MLIRYTKDIRGNMAAIFAVCIMMIMAAVGAAVDFTSIANKRAKYQSIADAAVLAAARSGEKKQKDLKKIALATVNANNGTGDKLHVKLKLNGKTGKIQVFVTGKHKTSIMGLFGKPYADVEALAEAPLSISDPANIVLVLDTTWSMNGTKMTALKAAANDLVDILSEYENENLQMGVVPFAQYVNVGLSRRNEVWLYDTKDYKVKKPDYCYYEVIGKTNCRMESYPATPAQPGTPAGTCYNDGVPYSCGGSGPTPYQPGGESEVCDNVYSPTQTCVPQFTEYTWYGCVGSRMAPLHLQANYKKVKIPGLYNISCSSEIQTLTHDLKKVKATISGLAASGETYLPSGLIWGWRELTRKLPLLEAKAKYKKNTRSIMILMTDGKNTLSKNYSSVNEKLHTSADVADADKVSAKLCKRIKKDEIEIYTIAYDIKNKAAKDLVKNCASTPGLYFEANNSTELKKAFKDIGQSLLKLRLTH